ncbi:MAG: hypothetical protein ACRDUY_01050 [Nitriliruptorales bacterium]
MSRITVYHVTRPRRLPLIEEEGLRTRADLSRRLGPLEDEDRAAPGRYAFGRRVSAYLDEDQARARMGTHGGGLVSFSVDPAKSLGVPGSARTGDPADYWESGRPLDEWLAGEPPADLEVHQPVGVRAKHLRIHAPVLSDDELDDYAPLVAALADEDRLSAKAVMHLCIIESDGDFDSADFRAAVALAYRDEADPDDLVDEMLEIGPDKITSAVLAEQGPVAPGAVERLRAALEDTRTWGEAQGLDHGRALLVRSTQVLDGLDAADL